MSLDARPLLTLLATAVALNACGGNAVNTNAPDVCSDVHAPDDAAT